jgi:large subunit ribosomal protein L7Ae
MPPKEVPQKKGKTQPKKTVPVKPVKKVKVPNPLFQARPRNQRIGGDLRGKGRDLSRFVRWPRNVRLQRQKKILLQRLKVPPVIAQFSKTLDKNQAAELFKLLVKYQPETKAAKTQRLENLAKAKAAGDAVPIGDAPNVIKFGLKHVTTLIEQKKANLVVIAHDVDPVELVVWLPALCRKMNVPFAIVKGKSRLGTLVHKKNTAVVALTSVNKEDETKLSTLQENFRTQFNNNVVRKWGGGQMGLKTVAKLEKRRKQVEAEQKKIQAALK